MEHGECKNTIRFEIIMNTMKGSPHVEIDYCYDCKEPYSLDLTEFEGFGKNSHLECEHNYAQRRKYMMHMNNIGRNVKPFSITMEACPFCHKPMGYYFEIFGDLNKHPRIKDMHKYYDNGKRNRKKIPKTKITDRQAI